MIERLLPHVPPLAPTRPGVPELGRHIAALDAADGDTALQAGLYAWNGELDASHRLSQSLETPLGSYWHGIMHRMEGDYGNANYWFARAGRHPIHEPLQEAAAALLAAREDEWRHAEPVGLRSKLEALCYAPVWTPATFTAAVELCVRSGGSGTVARTLLEEIQYEEIKRLTLFSCERSGGGGHLGGD
jgi:hypothetical protein